MVKENGKVIADGKFIPLGAILWKPGHVGIYVGNQVVIEARSELVDVEKEIARLEKDRKNVEGEIARAQGKLNNPGFVNKAPAALVEQERAKLEVNQGMLASLRERIQSLRDM